MMVFLFAAFIVCLISAILSFIFAVAFGNNSENYSTIVVTAVIFIFMVCGVVMSNDALNKPIREDEIVQLGRVDILRTSISTHVFVDDVLRFSDRSNKNYMIPTNEIVIMSKLSGWQEVFYITNAVKKIDAEVDAGYFEIYKDHPILCAYDLLF